MMVPCRDDRRGLGASYGSPGVTHNSIWPSFSMSRVKNLWLQILNLLNDSLNKRTTEMMVVYIHNIYY
jgi:hypothetical protein